MTRSPAPIQIQDGPRTVWRRPRRVPAIVSVIESLSIQLGEHAFHSCSAAHLPVNSSSAHIFILSNANQTRAGVQCYTECRRARAPDIPLIQAGSRQPQAIKVVGRVGNEIAMRVLYQACLDHG
jgi:hypothetical protein